MPLLVNKKINLEDSSGQRWVVTVSNDDGSFAFKEGWDVFSLNHGLDIGYLVVFNCINKLDFDVKIYDKSICERLEFSKKKNRKKRSRCRSGSPDRGCMEDDLGGAQNSTENDNDDGRGKTMRTLEQIVDTCCITSRMYQNDVDFFNIDPMFEEVLGTGDASYASKLELFGRNNSFGATDKSAYDMTSALILEENEENKSIMSNMEFQEYNFSENLGSDQAAVSGERFNGITNLIDAQIHIGEIKEVPMNMTPKMCSSNDQLHATELPEGEFNQDNERHFETASAVSCVVPTDNDCLRFNEISNLLDDQIHYGEVKEVPMDMTPKSCSLNDQSNVTGLPETFKREFNEDIESDFETAATVTCVVLTDNGCLKLPKSLSLPHPKRLRMKRTVVLLRDPLRRLWPVLYVEETWLTSGWLDFQRANNIKQADVCVFQVENRSERIITVDIDHK
ncbi:B3 domain-containing protein Os01g0905400-like isoform X2 [Cicer arietinum]|nr:uncharacterized protein LOC101495675 isoform X2 [Cicer arietinum]